MAIVKLNLTEDHLKLISHLQFGEMPDLTNPDIENPIFGIDLNSIFGGSFTLEDISYILHRYDEHIEGSEDKAFGPQFPEETENYFMSLYTDIIDHLKDIEEIVHQFSVKGGITPGTYKCKSNEHIWSKIEG